MDLGQSALRRSVPATARDIEQIARWNRTRAPLQGPLCIHHLFEAQVRLRPHAVAVSDLEGTLTYAQLDRAANCLAHRLGAMGIEPDTLVGVCVPRSRETLIAVLGILKAGGAYLPLDPSYPLQRLQFMQRDAQLRCVLGTPATQALCAQDAHFVDVIDAINTLESVRPLARSNPVSPHHLAYAIYTSGSTGAPKASLLEHRGLCNMAHAQAQVYAVAPGSKVLQFASMCFDASTAEWVMALTAGAQLCMITDEIAKSPDALSRYVADNQITHATLPPVLLPLLERDRWDCVRTLLLAGEAPNRELAVQWSEGRELYNAYGPSEVTVWVSAGRIVADQDGMHMGRPISNTECHVLDEHMEPVPIGVAGELYVAGIGVSRGYLDRPELNAQKFLSNPFSADVYPRLFRTGDRVRWRHDGNLEFLGRCDRQIKIRGFRVELEEIERVLESHSEVASAAVELRGEGHAKHLVAYVIASPEAKAESQSAGVAQSMSQWSQVLDSAPEQAGSDGDPFSDFYGWNSSFTGLPIPRATMEEWRTLTVERIQSYCPRRVLEIGCGGGLLLSRIVRNCDRYVGIDIATSVVARLAANIPSLGADAAKVELHVAAAHELSRFAGESFDTIVINSVAQCFPSREYLDALIDQIEALLSDGGRLFIGDVRHYGWNEAFHTAVERSSRADEPSEQALQQALAARLENEKELVIAPDYFVHRARNSPMFGTVELLPKVGRRDCEMNSYRYDVIMHRRGAVAYAQALPLELEWSDIGSLEALAKRLRERPSDLSIRNIPNARIAHWRSRTSGRGSAVCASDPTDWLAAAASAGRQVRFQLGLGAACDRFHVLLTEQGSASRLDATRETDVLPINLCCNDPWFNAVRVTLGKKLETYLESSLAEFMRPSTVVVLRQFPRTPNGKIDRSRLPTAHRASANLCAPQREVQKELCHIWMDLLGISQIGITDNFYRLGGDSLSAVRMQVAIDAKFGVKISLTQLQQAPTLAEIAASIELHISRAKLELARAGGVAIEDVSREVIRL